jgi:hypothetical protein
VRALSTGLRIFPFSVTEMQPELVPGDSVVVVTDQYTDYEPSSRTPLRGMLAIRGVLVRVGNVGRDLAIFVPGLIDTITGIQGGGAGTLPGLGTAPAAPILGGSFSPTGEFILNSQGSPGTSYQKVAIGTVMPTDAFTRAGAPLSGQNQTGLPTGFSVAAGVTAYIKAFAYAVDDTESAVSTLQVTREGSGTPDPPVPTIVPLNTEVDDSSWALQFAATPGSGGGGTNITYSIRQKIGFAVETVLASGNGTTLPKSLTITRHPRLDKAIRFVVTDTITGLVAVAFFTVPTARPEVDDTGVKLNIPVTTSTGTPVNRQLAKLLSSDPDTADSLVNGASKRVTTLNEATGGGRGFSGMDSSARVIRAAGFDDANYAAAATNSVGTALHGNVAESGTKAVNRLYAKGISSAADTADTIANGITSRVIPDAIIDFSTSALKTSVDRIATVAGQSAHLVARQVGHFFNEAFDELPSTWSVNNSNGVPTLALTNGATVGKNVLQSTGPEDWRTFPVPMAFNPTKLYRIRSRFRATANVTSGGTNSYIGVACYSDVAFLGNVYVGAVAVPTTVASGWIEQTGWFKGLGFGGTHYSADATNPALLISGTTQIAPLYIFRDSVGLGGTNQLDYIQIDELDEDAASRTYNVIGTGINLKTGVLAEPSGRYVQRMYAKGLLADPDTLDASGFDGITYRRILSVSSGLITPPSSIGRNRTFAYDTGGATLSTGAAVTLTFNSNLYDVGGLHSTSVNTDKVTVPAGGNVGAWMLAAQVTFGANATGDRRAFITKNGVVIADCIVRAASALATIIHLNAFDNQPTAGDVYQLSAQQNSGGSVTVNAGSSVTFLSATHLW